MSTIKPLVVTSIHPLSMMAADVGGDWLDVRQLLKDNQDPHHVALTFSQRRLLADADLVLWVSPYLETFLVQPLKSQPEDRQFSLAAASRSLDLDSDGNVDPHLWLRPEAIAGYYRELAKVLAAKFPEKRQWIADRVADRLAALDAKLADIEARLSRLNMTPVIVDHQAYSHFTRYFSIPLAGALVDDSGVAAGAKGIAGLAGTKNVACVIVEQLPAPQRAQKMAAALGVNIIAIDPMGMNINPEEGLVALLESMTRGFERCLGNPKKQG
ncbi:MAG: metal ABC transporter solute-binding protein, Zn/Mn family [Porticoccaceae bacterium]